ncbi:cystathionine gamma-lyase [Ancylostoma caninum]|uniref:cystathionine gamma-lyase n=1 Tax=Ancylostoma caninum TaxID=29170 RepID=A0A368GVF7_ANCCA|nr:cystathionine gamma-lyase [Ancylostoma caninum]
MRFAWASNHNTDHTAATALRIGSSSQKSWLSFKFPVTLDGLDGLHSAYCVGYRDNIPLMFPRLQKSMGCYNSFLTIQGTTREMSGESFPHFGTAAIHVGQEPEQWDMNQVVAPISLSTTYKQDRPGEPKGHDYSRAGNPSRDVLQKCLASLEDGKYCHVFASGLAASMAVVNMLKAGDHIICSDDVYGGTQRFIRRVSVPQHSTQADFVDLTDLTKLQAAFKPNTKMVWMETPSNPLLKVVDIAALVHTVKKTNPDILVVVDNTFMSPYFQRPLTLGADIVVHSITKYINGHSDVVMGAVITDNDDIQQHLFFQQLAVGAVPSPFDCFLVNRGLKTLHLRMRAHYENALAIAKYLEANERVEKVLYPALPSHPQHKIHLSQTKGMSGMMSFYLKGGLEESRTFLSSLKIFTLAESLGGYESLAELPSIMTHASVPAEERKKLQITDNLIRLSVGVENLDDLIADLDQALKAAVKL